jgi:hypothetical protein
VAKYEGGSFYKELDGSEAHSEDSRNSPGPGRYVKSESGSFALLPQRVRLFLTARVLALERRAGDPGFAEDDSGVAGTVV